MMIFERFTIVVALAFSFCLSPLQSFASEREGYLIEGVNLIPMTSETVIPNQSVYVEDAVIRKICHAGEECGPRGVPEIDGRGKYLMPGLTDMHTHLDFLSLATPSMSEAEKEEADRILTQQLTQYVLFGVTTVRDTAGTVRNLETREEIEAGKRVGPRIFAAHILMDGEPPLHGASVPFSSPEKAVAQVRESAKLGFDLIKVYSTLSQDVYDAIMDKAASLGVPVIGHLPMLVDFEHAIRKGLKSIEHMSGYDVACAKGIEDMRPTVDEIYQGYAYCTPDKIRALAELTARYPVWVTPTLVVADSVKAEYDRYVLIDEEEQKYTPPKMRMFTEYWYEIFSHRDRAALAGTRNVRLGLVKALQDAGVPLLVGTDTMASGYNVHKEMRLMAEAGLTPYQVLVAATAEPARFFGKEGEFGTLVVGASADMVLLEQNPLEDIGNVSSIAGVMLRGMWWDKQRIEAERQKILAAYRKAETGGEPTSEK